MQPGDAFVLNAPYNGGTHLPDITVIAPVFLNDEPLPLGGRGRGEGSDAQIAKDARKQAEQLPAEIRSRARSLRHAQTDAEAHRGGGSECRCCKFRRRIRYAGDAKYIADFYCHEARLVVELGGGQHTQRESYDMQRDSALRALGIRTLRFWNNDVFLETESVLESIWTALENAPNSRSLTPTPLPEGEGFDSVEQPATRILRREPWLTTRDHRWHYARFDAVRFDLRRGGGRAVRQHSTRCRGRFLNELRVILGWEDTHHATSTRTLPTCGRRWRLAPAASAS